MRRPLVHGLRPISDRRYLAAESPLWDDRRGVAFFVDIKGHLLAAYDPETGELKHWSVPEDIGFVALTDGDALVLGLKSGLVAFVPETRSMWPIGDFTVPEDHRLNDGKVDADGRLYFGSVHLEARAGAGALWRLEKTGTVRKLMDGLTIPNGPAFGNGGEVFFCETSEGGIFRLCETRDGRVRKPILRVPPGRGRPDGLAVDPHGRMWSGLWEGAALLVHDPSDASTGFFPIGATFVTSLSPIGRSGRRILVTSACLPFTRGLTENYETEGMVFSARLDFDWPAVSSRFPLSRV